MKNYFTQCIKTVKWVSLKKKIHNNQTWEVIKFEGKDLWRLYTDITSTFSQDRFFY